MKWNKFKSRPFHIGLFLGLISILFLSFRPKGEINDGFTNFIEPKDTVLVTKTATRIMDAGYFEENYGKPKNEFWVCYFWATWCLNCVKNHNILAQMDKQFRDQHVRMISLSLDSKKGKWQKFLEDHPADWEQVYLADMRFTKKFRKDFSDMEGLPQMFLIDRTGKPRRIQFLNQLKSELQKAIEEG